MTDDHQQTGTGWPQPRAASERRTDPDPADPANPDADLVDGDLVDGDVVDADVVDADRADAVEVPDEPPPDEPPPDEPPPPAATRRVRLSAAGAVIGLLLGLLGFAFVVQLRSNSTDQQLSADRPEDLVRILSDLDARKDRLSQEINTLETTQQQLAAGSQSRQAALAEASRRADELGILAGTLPAQGPGLRIEFRAGAKAVQASDVLDAVEELRGAGAEAMQAAGTNGTAVRIVASSSFVAGSGGGLVVDGTELTGPFTLTVIGDPQTMQIALNIPNGVVDTVHTHGGNVAITSATTVLVSALHPVTNPRYAQPAG
jgi:uncharacterized protein YlxW (UPF0749 family)